MAAVVLVTTLGLTVGPTTPASAATIVADNGATKGLWVDGSGRLHALVSSAPVSPSPQQDQLRIVRHQAGTTTVDGTFGSGGTQTIPLANPYSWDAGGPGLEARVQDSGFAADGTVVVAWLATGYLVRSAAGTCSGSPCQKTVDEYDHARDRLVIDRYDLSGARLGRSDVAMPRNAWCSSRYGVQTYDPPSQTWYRAAPEACGSADRIPPNVDVLPSGAVAVPTYGTYEYPPAGGGPIGNSSVAFLSPSTGATLRTLTLASDRLPGGTITGFATGGAVVSTYDTHGSGPSTPAPTYVVPSDWGPPAAADPGSGCQLWAGPGSSTVRTCVTGGAAAVTVLSAAGATTWSRTIPAIGGVEVLRVAPQPDGRIALVAFGCADPAGTCPALSQVALRLGPSGAVDRFALAPLLSGSTSTYVWQAPVALPGGAQAVALDARTGSTATIETRLLGTAGTPPGAPTGVQASARRGQATVTWSAPPAVPGLPVTGYSLIVIADGVARSAVDIGLGTTEVVTGLAPGVLYRFQVAARNAAGTGAYSTASAAVTPPVAAYASHEQAAQRISAEVLGRAPTAAEQSSWAGQMQSGALTAGGLVARLRDSNDNTTAVDPVTRLYQAYFLRTPDPGGLTYWIGQRRGGRGLRSISDFFARSAEFTNRYGTLTNAAFVDLIYQNILGRPGDAGGVAFWNAELDSGRRSRGLVMIGFSESSEYGAKTADTVDVAVLHVLLLGRRPTPGELAADVAALADRTTTVAGLAERITASGEYAARPW